MPPPNFTAGQVMTTSAALNNDQSLSVYTFEAQFPYLILALQELEEYYQQNDIPVVQETSTIIPVDAGATEIGYAPAVPTLPDDMVEIISVWWRTRDTDPFVPLTKVSVLPQYMSGIQYSGMTAYVWQSNKIIFFPSNSDVDIKLVYLKQLFGPLMDENSIIGVTNAKTFLEYRTAALCAEFIGEDTQRATQLNGYAILGSDRATGIATKGKQSIPIRRRPFRASYKRRGR